MELNRLSTLSLNTNLRLQTLNKQYALADAQKEIATGRKADMGLSLGNSSSSVVTISSQIQFIEQSKVTNSFVNTRLTTMQISMTSIVNGGNSFIGQLTSELNGSLDKQLLQTIGQSALGEITSSVNMSVRGEFVFSGINTQSASLTNYQDPAGSSAKTAVQNAFTTTFGFSADNPAAQSISPTALKSFIDGPFKDLFNDANWDSLWTGSNQQGIKSKISTRELVETPTTANATAFRNVTAAAILIYEFADGALKPSAIDELAKSALELMAGGISEMATEQGKLGLVEQRVERANQKMDFQKNILTEQLSNLTDVNSYDAAVRLNQLVLSLEASYSVTARIQSLSFLNYL